MPKKTVIKKNEENPEPDYVLSDWIRWVSDSLAKLEDSGLNREAIVILVHHDTKLSQKNIVKVFDSLRFLKEKYCKEDFNA